MYKTALKLLKTIKEKGFDAYIVGGYPRDLYLKRDSLDVDICTSATPKDLKEIFEGSMLPTVQYGSVTVIINNVRFEITTFRKDIKYENNRVPIKIKYIDSLMDDLKRRDFTINTLCIDENGTTIDLMGSKKDLDGRLVKMVGDPKSRLKEDALRILRAIRFATILDFEIDADLKKYIKKYGYLLKKLSYYRKKEELDKIFSSANREYGIKLIKDLCLDDPLELNLDRTVLTSSAIGIWAQLSVIDKYTFTNSEKEIILKVNELFDKNLVNPFVLYEYGLYYVSLAGEIKGISRKMIASKYDELPIKSKKDIRIDVDTICAILNKKPNGFIKDIYNDLEKEILIGNLKNETSDLEEYIRSNYE